MDRVITEEEMEDSDGGYVAGELFGEPDEVGSRFVYGDVWCEGDTLEVTIRVPELALPMSICPIRSMWNPVFDGVDWKVVYFEITGGFKLNGHRLLYKIPPWNIFKEYGIDGLNCINVHIS